MENQKLFVAHAAELPSSELNRTRELFNPELTLGFFALKFNAEYEASRYTFIHDPIGPQQYVELTHSMAESHYSMLQELDKAKLKFVGYSVAKEAMLARYLNNFVPKDIIDSIKTHQVSSDTAMSWRQWLSDYASDDEYLRIIAEHNDILLNHTENEEIHQDIDGLLKGLLSGIDALEEQDRIGSEPKHPLLVAIQYGDIFDTFLKERAGYYDVSKEQIVLGQGHVGGRSGFVAEAREQLPRVLTHEWVHGLLGKAFEDVTSPLASRWINEAITESISRIIRRHTGEIVVEDKTYIDERLLLSELVRPFKNSDFISKMIFRAYTGDQDDRDSLVEIIDEAHGAKDVLEKTTNAVLFEQTRLANGGVVDRLVEVTAIKRVIHQLRTNPDTILLRGVDRLINDTSRAATELT